MRLETGFYCLNPRPLLNWLVASPSMRSEKVVVVTYIMISLMNPQLNTMDAIVICKTSQITESNAFVKSKFTTLQPHIQLIGKHVQELYSVSK